MPQPWIDDTARGADDGANAFVTGDNPPDWPAGAHYRNCWWVRDPAAPFLIASGIYGQNVYVLPAEDLVVAKFSTGSAKNARYASECPSRSSSLSVTVRSYDRRRGDRRS